MNGPSVMLGYHGLPEVTAAALRDGWYRTGDLARRDADGNIFVTGRHQELIIRGGEKIHPAEVEEALRGVPGVADVAVTGRPHDVLGEVPVAFVVPGPEGFDPRAGYAACREKLSYHKVPEELYEIGQVPRTASGKVTRRLLLDRPARLRAVNGSHHETLSLLAWQPLDLAAVPPVEAPVPTAAQAAAAPARRWALVGRGSDELVEPLRAASPGDRFRSHRDLAALREAPDVPDVTVLLVEPADAVAADLADRLRGWLDDDRFAGTRLVLLTGPAAAPAASDAPGDLDTGIDAAAVSGGWHQADPAAGAVQAVGRSLQAAYPDRIVLVDARRRTPVRPPCSPPSWTPAPRRSPLRAGAALHAVLVPVPARTVPARPAQRAPTRTARSWSPAPTGRPARRWPGTSSRAHRVRRLRLLHVGATDETALADLVAELVAAGADVAALPADRAGDEPPGAGLPLPVRRRPRRRRGRARLLRLAERLDAHDPAPAAASFTVLVAVRPAARRRRPGAGRGSAVGALHTLTARRRAAGLPARLVGTAAPGDREPRPPPGNRNRGGKQRPDGRTSRSRRVRRRPRRRRPCRARPPGGPRRRRAPRLARARCGAGRRRRRPGRRRVAPPGGRAEHRRGGPAPARPGPHRHRRGGRPVRPGRGAPRPGLQGTRLHLGQRGRPARPAGPGHRGTALRHGRLRPARARTPSPGTSPPGCAAAPGSRAPRRTGRPRRHVGRPGRRRRHGLPAARRCRLPRRAVGPGRRGPAKGSRSSPPTGAGTWRTCSPTTPTVPAPRTSGSAASSPTRRTSTPPCSRSARARRSPWTRSSGCCWRRPGSCSSGPASTPPRCAAAPPASSPASCTTTTPRTCARRRPAPRATSASAPPAASSPAASRTRSGWRARPSPSTRPARRRWWRCTWPPRRCARATAPSRVAGGVAVMGTPQAFVEFSRQRGLAPDGRCKAFAEGADGTGWSEGVAVLLLERLSDARRHGHPVLAVLRGSRGQLRRRVQRAHRPQRARPGAGHPPGAGRRRAHRRRRGRRRGARHRHPARRPDRGAGAARHVRAGRGDAEPLRLGSLKSNLGHTQAAAGAAGVIKMVLAMRHGTLPRTLHVDAPTSEVDWSAGAVELLTEARPWPAVRPAPAGRHLLVRHQRHQRPRHRRGARRRPAARARDRGRESRARTSPGPRTARVRVGQPGPPHPGAVAALRGLRRGAARPGGPPAGLARRARRGRRPGRRRARAGHHPRRPRTPGRGAGRRPGRRPAGLTALTRGEADPDVPTVLTGRVVDGQLGLLFGGQGGQRAGMGRELHAAYPVFADAFDAACAELDRASPATPRTPSRTSSSPPRATNWPTCSTRPCTPSRRCSPSRWRCTACWSPGACAPTRCSATPSASWPPRTWPGCSPSPTRRRWSPPAPG